MKIYIPKESENSINFNVFFFKKNIPYEQAFIADYFMEVILSSFIFFFKNKSGLESRFNTLCGLASAALGKEIPTKIILDMDGVMTSVVNQQSYEALILQKDKISELIEMGAEIFLCSVCAGKRGVPKLSDHVQGIRFASPEMMSEIMSGEYTLISL